MSEGGQNTQTSSSKVHKFWGYNAHMVTTKKKKKKSNRLEDIRAEFKHSASHIHILSVWVPE